MVSVRPKKTIAVVDVFLPTGQSCVNAAFSFNCSWCIHSKSLTLQRLLSGHLGHSTMSLLSSFFKPLSPDTDGWLKAKSLKAATPGSQAVKFKCPPFPYQALWYISLNSVHLLAVSCVSILQEVHAQCHSRLQLSIHATCILLSENAKGGDGHAKNVHCILREQTDLPPFTTMQSRNAGTFCT